MLFFPVFAAIHPRRSLDSFPGLIPIPCPLSRNYHGIIFFADPHPLTPIESNSYRNRRGALLPSRAPRFAERRHHQLSRLGTPENTSCIHFSFQTLARCSSRNSFALTTIHFHGGCTPSFHFIFHSLPQGVLCERKNRALLRTNSFVCHTCAFHGGRGVRLSKNIPLLGSTAVHRSKISVLPESQTSTLPKRFRPGGRRLLPPRLQLSTDAGQLSTLPARHPLARLRPSTFVLCQRESFLYLEFYCP
jgi:hypothetical protein